MSQNIPTAGQIIAFASHNAPEPIPFVVVSPASYNATGLLLCCPVVSQMRGYPFEVMLTGAFLTVALSDQVRSVAWPAADYELRGSVSDTELAEIRAKLKALIGA